MKRIVIFLTAAFILIVCTPKAVLTAAMPEDEKVENIIFLIGDGMGLTQISALSMTQDYRPLNMERANHIGIQKTYSNNNRVTDSAASGTALACGEKTNNGFVAMDAEGNPLESALRVAQRSGRATAIVVTCPPTAATPAVFYANTTQRRNHEDIAVQLLESGIDVIAGSGIKYFNKRKDKRDLLKEFQTHGYTYAPDKEAFLAVDTPPVIMITNDPKNMPFRYYDSSGIRGEYLAEATAKALEMMDKSGKDGFFMMVEGSLIDYAGHDNDYNALLGEMRDFDSAVKVAYDYADAHPGTLVVVTGDHETGGLSIISNETDFTLAESGIELKWGTTSHSGTFLPVFAYGTGAGNFTGVMENRDIGRKLKKLMDR